MCVNINPRSPRPHLWLASCTTWIETDYTTNINSVSESKIERNKHPSKKEKHSEIDTVQTTDRQQGYYFASHAAAVCGAAQRQI
mmetsp:Transcript_8645/g.14034  ORF Transcript_8645/g.14034 Transcript_8645/m.14034 type:complete len:84 (-) Transcript_8645:35-286(-)